MLSQLVRSNTMQNKAPRTKATKYSDAYKSTVDAPSEDLEKISEYIKETITDLSMEESVVEDDFIVEDPNQVVVEFSDIYKEKEEILPFFRSIQAQLKAIYG